MKDIETVDSLIHTSKSSDPLYSVRSETRDRMKAALLSCSQDDPLSAYSAMQQVTLLRAYHQVTRIVQYLDLMDALEEKLYQSIENEILASDLSDFSTISKLLAIQEKLQKSIIESNKLLQPYLEMDKYTAFDTIQVKPHVPSNVLDITSSDRDKLRENAGAILSELKALSPAKLQEA